MGLDMYLYRKKHLGKAKIQVNILENEYNWYKNTNTEYTLENCTSITQEVGYWRKANAIHNWFVKYVQDDIDNCGEYYVPIERLKQLLEVCKEVKEKAIIVEKKVVEEIYNPEKKEIEDTIVKRKIITNGEEVAEILPTCEGFFFGSTDYDEWYLQDIDYTIELIENILKEDNNEDDYYYRSSW